MGRIYRSDKPITCYFKTESEEQLVTTPLRTPTAERFPRMSRRDRRKMERQIQTVVDRQEKQKVKAAKVEGERRVILTDEETK